VSGSARPSEPTARALARERREAIRERTRRIRRSVAGLTVTAFAVVFLIVYVQLASGHDPALAGAARRSTPTTSFTDGEPSTGSASSTDVEPSTGTESSTSAESSSASGSATAGSGSAGSTSTEESSTGVSAVTTSQS
jgi:hypothetical protein